MGAIWEPYTDDTACCAIIARGIAHDIHDRMPLDDRSLEALPDRVIVIAVDGELTVKRLERVGRRTYLTASNSRYRPIPLDGREAQVWGVVTHVVHALPGAPA